jgi:lipopolysaccharide transport system ATP-binding protein
LNPVVISARNLRKVYRLYTGSGYRFLDMFGMLGDRPGAYTEHAALDDISLEIRRGEKVAFIGRNGAGKSTLLKLFTRVIDPTSGTLEVTGKAHALLQIGTGFHPDFTGRENVYGYLAQVGVSGADADRKYEGIVEFAELEEYISQPLKTYSTGMAVRLMFATSTAITPDLLVLDEVLGVGDAYFAQKSYARIRELCARDGATLLLVTHDVYSAVNLCERVVWIDRGRVLMDGDGPSVVKAYEDSVRQQEEHRLRLKKQQQLKAASSSGARHALLELSSRSGQPQPGPVYFSSIRLLANGGEISSLPLGADAFDQDRGAHLVDVAGSWGDGVEWEGRATRPMLNYGNPYHKVAGTLVLPAPGPRPEDLSVVIAFAAPAGCDLVGRLFIDGSEYALGELTSGPAGWSEWTASAPAAAVDAGTLVNATGISGNGTFTIRDARFVVGGEESHQLRHGDAALLEIDYTIHDPALHERSQVVIAIHREGVQDVCRFISRDLLFDGRQARGTIRLSIARLSITDGEYTVTIMIAREGYYDRTQTLFYTVNPDVHCTASRLFSFAVTGSGLVGRGTAQVAEGTWSN